LRAVALYLLRPRVLLPVVAPAERLLELVPTPPGEPLPSDDALCRAFLEGDSQAFGQLLARHQALVYRLVRRYAGTPDDARDLAQRAFLQAFEAAARSLPRLGKAGVPFRAWLLRIAVNLGKN